VLAYAVSVIIDGFVEFGEYLQCILKVWLLLQLSFRLKHETNLDVLQPASLADQLAEAKEQLSSALQQLGTERYFLKFADIVDAQFC